MPFYVVLTGTQMNLFSYILYCYLCGDHMSKLSDSVILLHLTPGQLVVNYTSLKCFYILNHPSNIHKTVLM